MTCPCPRPQVRRAIQQMLFQGKNFSWIRHVAIAVILLTFINLLVIFAPSILGIFGLIGEWQCCPVPVTQLSPRAHSTHSSLPALGATSAPCLIFIFPAIFYIRISPKDKEPLRSTPKILVSPRPPPQAAGTALLFLRGEMGGGDKGTGAREGWGLLGSQWGHSGPSCSPWGSGAVGSPSPCALSPSGCLLRPPRGALHDHEPQLHHHRLGHRRGPEWRQPLVTLVAHPDSPPLPTRTPRGSHLCRLPFCLRGHMGDPSPCPPLLAPRFSFPICAMGDQRFPTSPEAKGDVANVAHRHPPVLSRPQVLTAASAGLVASTSAVPVPPPCAPLSPPPDCQLLAAPSRWHMVPGGRLVPVPAGGNLAIQGPARGR